MEEKYTVFARKYRAQDFDEIVGQEHVVQTLKNAILSKNISHAYLFAGPRGVGKTSMARIFAKSLNCEKGPTIHPCNQCTSCKAISNGTSLDVIEIDGASHRKIDDIRKIIEELKYSPMGGKDKWKIYIIDEVHMLTNEAFNALLKSLEEPPEYVIFIFATTEPYKVPETILSRCQRFDFRRIPLQKIIKKLKDIAKNENIEAEEQIFPYIAMQAEGSLRDAEVLLDQINSFTEGKITLKIIQDFLGIVDIDWIIRLLNYIYEKDAVKGIELINEVFNQGLELSNFLLTFLKVMRDIILLSGKQSKFNSILYYPYESYEKYANDKIIKDSKNIELIKSLMRIAEETYNTIKYTKHPLLNVEVMVVKMIQLTELYSIDDLITSAEAAKVLAETQNNSINSENKKKIKTEEKDVLVNEEKYNGFLTYVKNMAPKLYNEYLNNSHFYQFEKDTIYIFYTNITRLNLKELEIKDFSPIIKVLHEFFNDEQLKLEIVWEKCQLSETKDSQIVFKEEIISNFPELGRIINTFNASVKKKEKEKENGKF